MAHSLVSPDSLHAAVYWTPHFKIAQLPEVMRQKDDAKFAHMLNRLRVRQAHETLQNDDLKNA